MVNDVGILAAPGDPSMVATAPIPEPLAAPEQPEPQPEFDQRLAAEIAKVEDTHKRDKTRFIAAQRKETFLNQQLAEQRKQLEEAMAEIRKARELQQQQQLNELPEEAQTYAKEAMTLRQQLEEAQRLDAQRVQQWNEIARPIVVQKIASLIGMPVEELQDYNDPVQMQEAGIKYLRGKLDAIQRENVELKAQLGQSPTGQVIRGQPFASGGSGAAPRFNPSDYAGSGKVEEYLAAKRKAGLL